MFRKLSFIISILLVLALVKGASAVTWTNADSNDDLWSTPGNWDGGVPAGPDDGDNATLDNPDVNGPLVEDGIDAVCVRLRGPGYSIPPGSDLTITGGTLTFGRYWRIGFGPAAGTVNMSGGKITNVSNYAVYMNEGSTFNLSDGVVETGLWIPSELSTSHSVVTTLNMTGGIVNTKDPNVAEGQMVIEIGVRGQDGVPRPGLVNLHGGTIITQQFVIGPEGEMDITEGTMIIDSDVTGTIEGYVNSGVLTAYGGAGQVVYNYDDVDDVTIVTAVAQSPFSFLPQPGHGSEGVCPDVVLEWNAGQYAAWQDVYFGTDFNDVNEATTSSDVHVSHQSAADANYDPLDLLDFGTTYYWRVDAVNDVCSPYLWKGRVWSFTVDSGKARNPSPPDLAWRVATDTDLGWEAGCLAESHDVYLGTDPNDVSNATTATAGIYKGRHGSLSYEPGVLDSDTIHYWRIDEVGTATIVKGDLWSFETIAPGETPLMCDVSVGESTLKEGWSLLTKDDDYPEPGTGGYGSDDGPVTWSDMNSPDGTPTGIDLTLDTGASGYLGGRTWGGEPLGMDYFFANDQGGSPDADIIINLGDLFPGTYRLTTFHNNTWYGYGAGPIGEITVTGGITYSDTLTPLPAEQTSSVTDAGICRVIVAFDATGAEDVTLRYKPGEGGAVYLNGFILDYYSVDKRYAYWPLPRHGAREVQPDVELSWSPGIYAADPGAHDVYFGTSWEDVNSATTSSSVYIGSQNLDANTYDPPGLLDLATTYYWRIDERNDANGNLWKGSVWKFTVANFVTIDGFESYDDDNRIYHTWVDLIGGSSIDLGTKPFSPAHTGDQSMMCIYDNTSKWDFFHYWSEIELPFDSTTDLTYGGQTKVMTLYFYGDSGNDANDTEELYVGLKGSYAEVRYSDDHGNDNNDLRLGEWIEWNIPISEFIGVDPCAVTSLVIGFGDSDNTTTVGGYGIVYFDDIRLYPPRCVPDIIQPEGDLNNDCAVTWRDVEIMAAEWLESDVDVSPVQNPGDANLVGHWELEGNADDSTANNYHGSAEGDHGWITGKIGSGAIDLSGGWVVVEDEGNTPKLRPTDEVSVATWIRMNSSMDSGTRIVIRGRDDVESYATEVGGDGEFVFFVRDANGAVRHPVASDDALALNEWIHIAGTYDNNEIAAYVNGQVEQTDTIGAIELLADANDGLGIGGRYGDTNLRFEGGFDDVRVYDRGLTRAEVAYLASQGTGTVPLDSEANLYSGEAVEAINIRDLAVLLDHWLEEKLWP